MDAHFFQGIEELLEHDPQTFGNGLACFGAFGVDDGPFEVVEHGQHVFDRVFFAAFLRIVDFATGALAIVVEVSRCAQQLIAQFRDFGERVRVTLFGCRLGGSGFGRSSSIVRRCLAIRGGILGGVVRVGHRGRTITFQDRMATARPLERCTM